MSQLADLLIVVLMLVAVARQFPQIMALLGKAPRPTDATRDRSNGPAVIDLVLCNGCRTASPLTARFCAKCGDRLPARRAGIGSDLN